MKAKISRNITVVTMNGWYEYDGTLIWLYGDWSHYNSRMVRRAKNVNAPKGAHSH